MKNLLKLMDLSEKEIQIVLYLLPDKKMSSSELEQKLNIRQPSMSFYLKSLAKKHIISKSYSKSKHGRPQLIVGIQPQLRCKLADKAQKLSMEFESDMGKLL